MVTDVLFVPYRDQRLQKEDDREEEEKIIETLKKNYLTEYFYFSYGEPITISLSSRENGAEMFN